MKTAIYSGIIFGLKVWASLLVLVCIYYALVWYKNRNKDVYRDDYYDYYD